MNIDSNLLSEGYTNPTLSSGRATTPQQHNILLLDQQTHSGNMNSTTQMDNTSSILSSSNSASGITNSASVMRFVKDNIWQFFTIIQHRYTVKGKKMYLLFLTIHLYYMYISMILPTLSTQIQVPSSISISSKEESTTSDFLVHGYPFGMYGMWLFKIINYPITLSLDWIPYEAAIAIMACTMAISLIHILLLVVIFKTKFGRLQEKFKRISLVFAVCILFIGPPASFVMASFIDCNYQQMIYSEVDMMYSPSLFRFPQILCMSGTNVSMIVVSTIGIVLLSFAWLLSMFILPTSNPKSQIPFLLLYKLPLCIIYTTTGLRILIHFAIPSQYAYARAAFHIIVAIGFAMFIAYQVPLYKRVENSFVFAVMCSYCAFSIGLLISSIVNMSSTNDYDILGISLAAGLTIGLALISFILAFVGFEIYTYIVYKSIQRIIRSKHEGEGSNENGDGERTSIYLVCEDSSLRNLKLYLQFVTHSGSSADISQALAFIKAESPQKFFTSSSILMMASDLVARCWGDENRLNFALFLLKKSFKYHSGPWLAMQIKFKLRDVESELFENANYGKFGYQVKNVLMEIEKKQDQIKSIHKLFWKELLSDIPNNEKLERINATATHLTHYCEDQFEHLMANFAHDKTVLRYYATFLETIKQDKESASVYYDEATNLEEEDTKARTTTLKRFRNKIVPDLPESNSWNFLKSASSRREFNEDVEKDSFAGIEKQLEKKQNIYRASLNTPFKSQIRLSFFFSLVIGAYCLGSTAFLLSLIYGDYLTRTDLVKVTSLPSLTTGALLRDIRMRQIVLELFNNENRTLPLSVTNEYTHLNYFLSSYKNRIRSQRDILLDLSTKSRSGQFTQIMYSDFTRDDNTIQVPFASESGKLEYRESFPKNTSISDMIQEMIQHATYFNLASDSDFNKTTTLYPFMYLYHNRISAAAATYTFFKNFQKNHRVVIHSVDEMLWNYFLLAPLCLVVIFSASIAISRIEMHRLTLILNLYRKLPKDMIGVIYHDIDKKGEDVKYEKSNLLLRPKDFSIIATILVVCVIASYSGIVYSDVYQNVSTANSNLFIVDQISVLIRSTHTMTAQLVDLYSYYALNSGIPVNNIVNNTQLVQYKQEARKYTRLIASCYNDIVYGTNTSQPLIGKFPKIDNIINGPSNCTADSPVEECSSLQAFISAFTIACSQMTEEFFNPSFQKMDSLFYQVLSIYNMNDVLYEKLLSLMTLLFNSTSESYKVLTITFFIGGSFFYFGFSVLLLFSFVIYDRQITNLRSFLNYLPVDFIDSNEPLRNFIYFNSISFFKKKNNELSDDSLRNVLSSMVDGALLVNEKSEIMLFNLTAQKMFGKAPEEVIGLRFYNLFDQLQEEKLTIILKQVKGSLSDPNGKHGETIELDCIRKNQSKFPAIVNVFATREKGSVMFVFFIKDITSEKKQNALLNEEKKNSENLLRNILPDSVAFKLKAGETLIAEKISDITCFFSDMVGFTKFSSGMNPNELVIMLNTVVNGFDDLTDRYHLEKIKTIGDAYFCVGGLHGLNAQSDHPERCVRFSIDTLQVIKDYNTQNPHAQINIRVGLNTGSVVAGVIGRKKFAYDLWGDTINIASRMESNSMSGRIQLSRTTYERVYDIFEFEERKIEVKGKGSTLAYLLKDKYHCNPIITIESTDDEDEVRTENDEIEVEKKDSTHHTH